MLTTLMPLTVVLVLVLVAGRSFPPLVPSWPGLIGPTSLLGMSTIRSTRVLGISLSYIFPSDRAVKASLEDMTRASTWLRQPCEESEVMVNPIQASLKTALYFSICGKMSPGKQFDVLAADRALHSVKDQSIT